MTSTLPSRTSMRASFCTTLRYEPPIDCSLWNARHSVKITSCGVNGWPLENFTPSRRVNSQVVSSTAFQAVASRGTRFILASWPISVSKMCEVIASLGVTWW